MDDKLYESTLLRDQNFEVNGEKMMTVNRDTNISFWFGCVSGLLLVYVTLIACLAVMGRIAASGAMAQIVTLIGGVTDTSGAVVGFSGWFAANILALGVFPFSFLANKFYSKLCGILLYADYVLFFVLGIIALLEVPDDMPWWLGIPMIIYGVVGFWTADLCFRSLKELDYLVTQEGFPTFNLSMHYFGRSRYVKFREKWLDKNKKLNYYSESEKPVENVIVTAAETADGMDGVSADSGSEEKWFEKNMEMTAAAKENVPEDDVMDGIDLSGLELPEEESFYRDKADPKRKEL